MPLRAALILLALAFPGSALAGTSVGQPFPSNLFTTPDASQITGLRVDLAKPDCAARPNDCADIDVLNTLDGFNIQPRVSVPFSGPIDVSTVSSENVFLVGPGGQLVGINQAVWEPVTNTLHFESDEQLAQHTTYLLVVAGDVKDARGEPVGATFRRDLNFGQTKEPATKAYRKALLDALPMAMAGGVDPDEIAGASLFTTQSIDADSRKIRAQLRSAPAPAANFLLGTGGERTVFPLGSFTAIQSNRQTGTSTFSNSSLPTPALFVSPGSVGTIAFGSYASPDYETGSKVIPATGTLTGVPAAQGTNTIGFTLFVPSGVEPANGWPVVISGHGFTDSKNGAPWTVAASLARAGLASIAINAVGHGGGPLSRYTVLRPAAAPIVLPAGGRAIDQDGNGTFDSTEGVNAAAPYSSVGSRDGLRQTTIDLMQLVHVLGGGVDFDGDGAADLDGSRVYYAGQSFGGIYGVQLLGLEPAIRAGVPNVAGAPIIEIARLSLSFRPLVGFALFSRVPSLYNASPNPPFFTTFVENIPLRNAPLVIDTVPGASAIQQSIDRSEWVQQAANAAAYAPFITAPVIFQFARGDKTVPNPTSSAIIRAGGLESQTTLYRHDLAHAANPAVGTNPHTFLTSIFGATAPYAVAAQTQIATFFATDGTLVIDPDGPGPFFETPMVQAPPEDLAYIP